MARSNEYLESGPVERSVRREAPRSFQLLSAKGRERSELQERHLRRGSTLDGDSALVCDSAPSADEILVVSRACDC